MAVFSEREFSLHPISGEIREKSVERDFRDFAFLQEKKGILTFSLIATLGQFGFGVTECFYKPFDWDFLLLQLSRCGLLILIIGATIAAMRIRDRRAFERLAFAAAMIAFLLSATVKHYTPMLQESDFIFYIVIILSYYLFFRLPFRIQFIPPILLTLWQLYLLFTHSVIESVFALNVLATSFLLSNIIGGIASRQANITTRQYFIKYSEEAELREQLEITLKRLDLLEGLVPICAHCKRIKDDDGRWEEVEAFVMRGSKVKFSHGICPECLTIHY